MAVTLHPGDCRAVLATLPDASVQCCVSSPPYYGLRSYGIGTENGELGLEASPDAYVTGLVAVFREIRRVLADSGCVFLNVGDAYADKQLLMMPARVALALQADAWVLRSDIIWAKPNPMPESCRDRPTSAHEHVFLLSKRASYFWDAEAVAEDGTGRASGKHTPDKTGAGKGFEVRAGFAKVGDVEWHTRNLRDVWTIATQPYSGAHFATMPPDLAERCIKAGTSERGQCPHCAAPWARVVDVREDARTPYATTGTGAKAIVAGRNDGLSGVRKVLREDGSGGALATKQRTTTGWQPACACPEHAPVPQSVLDPFAGAGTTGLVADRLGRNAVLIELNPAYAGMARDRITDDAPLFASVALAEATTSRWAEAAD